MRRENGGRRIDRRAIGFNMARIHAMVGKGWLLGVELTLIVHRFEASLRKTGLQRRHAQRIEPGERGGGGFGNDVRRDIIHVAQLDPL